MPERSPSLRSPIVTVISLACAVMLLVACSTAPSARDLHNKLPKSVARAEIAYVAVQAVDEAGEHLPNGVMIQRVAGARAPHVLARGTQQYAALDWSPDGRRLVFDSDQDRPGDFDLFTVNADGSALTNLTPIPGNDAGPAWSPDGTKIAFTSNRAGEGVFDLYVMNSDGTDARRLTQGVMVNNPDWSPDGTRIVYAQAAPTSRLDTDIWTIGADGEAASLLVGGPGAQSFPTWSPDGKLIAYIDESGGPAQLRTVTPEGTAVRRVSPATLNASFPDWSPDSKRIAFTALHVEVPDDPGEVYTVRTSGGAAKNVSRTPDHAERMAKWSPDGKGLAFTASFAGQELLLVVDSRTGRGMTIVGRSSVRAIFPAWRPSGSADEVEIDEPNGPAR